MASVCLKSVVLAFVFLVWSAYISVMAAPIFLFDGSGLPENQGFSVTRSFGNPSDPASDLTVVPQTGGGLGDVLHVETSGSATINAYQTNTNSGRFIASIRVAVERSSHNEFDAGFMFSVIGSGVHATFFDRTNSLFIDPAGIGFMDNPLIGYSVDATQFHEYAIHFSNDQVGVFVDEAFSDILSGAAAPVLSRAVPNADFFRNLQGGVTQVFFEGVIGFGDHTNDAFVNSAYTVDFIKFESFGEGPLAREPSQPAVIPIPSALPLFLTGLGIMGLLGSWRRRKTVAA